ncbi:MAG: hypothetical protein KJZ69_15575, partial [Phycisphaerales bacterium]|nr:hypothetical protein [Phycisphaerales bacterium]
MTFEIKYEFKILPDGTECHTVTEWDQREYFTWWVSTESTLDSPPFQLCSCNSWTGPVEAVVDDCAGQPYEYGTVSIIYCPPWVNGESEWTLSSVTAPFPNGVNFDAYEVVNNCQIAQWANVPLTLGTQDATCPPDHPIPEDHHICIQNVRCRITVQPSDFITCAELTAAAYFDMIDFDPEAVGAESNFIQAVCCFMEAKTQGCEEIALGAWLIEILELYAEYFDGKTVDLEDIFAWLDCAVGLEEIDITEDQSRETNAPVGDGGAPDCDDPMRSDEPVHVAHGYKYESEVDVSVPLMGGALSIRRDYTSQYDYTGASLVGRNWSASPFTFIVEVEEGQQTIPWCGGPPPVWTQVEYAEDNGKYYPAGATNLFMEAASLTIDSVEYPVWRQVSPGEWEIDYLRTGANVDAHEVGLMRQRRDTYGNSWTYNYTDFGSAPPVARLTSIDCRNASNPTNPDAQIRFLWNTGSQYGLDGTLAAIQVVRFDVSGDPHQTHLIEYVYEADGDPNQIISGELGTPGDLIQVIVRERTESVDGNGAPINRVRITQYRYHDSQVTSRSNADGRLTVVGQDHQLKLIIQPEQVEAFGEEYGYNDVEAAAAALLAMDDGDELGTSGSPKVIDLASKIIAYEASGSKVSRQYIQAGCGCGGSAGESQRFDYAYIDTPTSLDTTEVREYVGGSTDVYRYHYYDWQVVGGSVAPTPYLAQYALIEPGATGEPDGRMWVTGYEYNSLRELTFVAMPSAMASYTPGSVSAQASYTKSTSAGLVHGYEYEDHRVKSMAVREGYDSNLANYAKVWEQDFDSSRPWLVSELRRFRTESTSPTDDEIEVTAFEYAFHSGDAIKWTKMSAEAELTSENGPTGTNSVYETAELFDTLGNNTWSLEADGALTKRVFDVSGLYQPAGRPLTVIRNSDTTGLPTGTGAKPALVNNDWDGRNADGLSLTTEYVYDIAGDIVSITLPGGVSTWSRREMRPFAGRTTVENYYASIVLPAKAGSQVNGPITITWYNAGNEVIGRSDYAVGDVGNYDPANGVYSLGAQLARSEASHSLSGRLEETREWWDAGHSPDITTYEYDDLGRLKFVADANGTITEHHEYDVLDRVLEVRVGADEQAMATVAQFFYDWNHTGDPEQGQGDGNLILSRLFTGEMNGSDPVVRDTEVYFDFRNRPVRTVNALPPHEIVVYDNLDRVTERGVFRIEPSAIDEDLTDRGLYTRRSYSQRGLAFRDSIATDPTATSPEFLESNRWFDPVGRPVVLWDPNAPIVKTDYDSLGRVKTRFVSRDEGLFLYGPGRNGSPPIDNEGEVSGVVAGDQVIEQTEYTYDASTTPKGTLDVVIQRHRLHDASPLMTGALTGSNSAPLSTGFFYDGFRRRIRTVNFGVGYTSNNVFEKGLSNPTWPPYETPDYDDYDWQDFIVEATEFGARGLVELQVDSEGKQTRFAHDMLGRRIAVVENYDDTSDLAIAWNGTLDRWDVTDIGTAADVNRATTFVYDGVGNIRKQVAHLPETSDPNDSEVQETEYVYGVTTAGGSLIDSNSLLGEVRYPDEGTGLAGTTREYQVLYQYNRLGELLGVEDQNQTQHAYTRDALGRVTLDAVTLEEPSDIDNWVLSLGVAFDGFGRLASVTSYSDQSGSTAVNQAAFTYSPLWQIKDVYQDHDGVVTFDGSGVPTGNTQRVQYGYSTADIDSGNHSRLSRITYPDGAEYDHFYGSSPDVDDRISRLTHLKIGGATSDTVIYQHVGLGMVASVDYPTPDVSLDRTLSHDGKRRTQGYQTQWEGVYPGWDRFGRVKKHAWVDGGYTTGIGGNPNVPPLVEIDYTYDRASNRLTRTDARPGASWADRDFKYTYDGLDRLTKAERGAQGGSWSHAVGGQQWALDMLGNWDSIANDFNGDGDYVDSGEEVAREHNLANEIEEIGGVLPFAYDAAGNMTEQDLPAAATKKY